MKLFSSLLIVAFLVSCASPDSYNNEQIRTQCPIGYHEEFSHVRKIQIKDNKLNTKYEYKCVIDK